ncbi:MAG: hypothetical protein L0H59_12350, partial [Tomitella sp.]|nr:hypothetical protein [Tomitella sp.]
MASTVVDYQRTHVPLREWTALSARLGAFVDSLIDRKDVIAAIGVAATPIVGGTRPAGVFDQSTGTVTVDAAQTLLPEAEPGRIDLRDRRDCAAHPVLAGVVAHESGHAAHTVCRGMQRARTEQWSALLEEPRMEGRIVAGRPSVRTWLQASATQIIGMREPTSASSAASMLLLLGGRIAAGVFDADDLPDLTGLAAEHLTGEQIDV